MVSYRYLGSALTNANGVATFDYKGTGAGEIDVIASLDKPITDGSIVSGTLSVFDYFLYDSGINDGHKNTNVTIGTNVTEQVTSNGTVLTCTNGTSLATAQYTYTKVIGGDFEAYVTLTTPSSILMGFYGGSDSARISISNVENRTYKFKRTGSNWIVQYYNGSEWVDLSFYNNTLGNKDCRFYMYLYSNNETDTITFKDVKVTVEDSLNIGGDSIVQTGDTINITGKFYDMGVPVKNIDLDIYKNGVKVDTVNTGSTGVASYSYEGTGVGEVDFQFKYGYFVSETFSVWDYFTYEENDITASKTYNKNLNDADFYLEFTVCPPTNNSQAYIVIGDASSNSQIGDLYTNANCGINWTNGTFYGNGIPTETDTKVTVTRTGTSIILTVGSNTYNITGMNITCTTLKNITIVGDGVIKGFKMYYI